MVIKFYSDKEVPYGCFSNFSRHPTNIDDIVWKTSEHYYQAMKFSITDPKHINKIRRARSPMDAATLGRSPHHQIRKDWDDVKDSYMNIACVCKFSQHDDIGQILLDTGDETLIEDSPIDYYWGCGADGSGKNMLGIVLEEVRGIIKDQNNWECRWDELFCDAEGLEEESSLASRMASDVCPVETYIFKNNARILNK